MRSHLIPNILMYSFFLHHFLFVSTMISSCQVVNISQYSTFNLKVKVGTHFTLGKALVHQEVVHPVVPCRTRRSSAATPSEAEHHPPSAFCTLCIETFCTRETGSILCCWSSMYPLDTKILYLELCWKVPLAPISELVVFYRLPSSTL